MPRTRYDEPEDDGDEYDADRDYDPDDPDTYPEGVYVHGDERAVVPCPRCKASIDEESEQCPECGTYLSKEDAPAGSGLPAWVIVLAVALLAAMALSMLR